METPSLDELLRIAPTVVIVISVFVGGFVLCWKVMNEHIETLERWIDHLKNDHRK